MCRLQSVFRYFHKLVFGWFEEPHFAAFSAFSPKQKSFGPPAVQKPSLKLWSNHACFTYCDRAYYMGEGGNFGWRRNFTEGELWKVFKTDFREFKASPVRNANSFEQISFQNVKRFWSKKAQNFVNVMNQQRNVYKILILWGYRFFLNIAGSVLTPDKLCFHLFSF